MKDYLVVAFGGNAILPSGRRGTLDEQRENVRRMSVELGQLVLRGHRVVVSHGNGPQVGEIMLAYQVATGIVPSISLDVGGALSQGQIGYLLQQEIGNYLAANGMTVPICSVVTQVQVSVDDPAFNSPTKPIGRFYSAQEAEELRRERGWSVVEDAGRGYRRVVPSPLPKSIVEWEAIKLLADSGVLVVAAGGGGIPVVGDETGRLAGVEAVIDKDLSAQRLATLIGARTLVLLTEVAAVAINFGTPEQRPLGLVSLAEMRRHYDEGQFPPGSMGPKVRAAIAFLEEVGERVIITSSDNLVEAVTGGRIGTQIVRDSRMSRQRRADRARSLA